MKRWPLIICMLITCLLVLPLWLSCGGKDKDARGGNGQGEVKVAAVNIPQHVHHYDLKLKLRKYAQVNIDFDETLLSEPEKNALGKLVLAARLMDDIFLRQVWSGNPALEDTLYQAHVYSHSEPFTPIGEQHALVWDLNRFFAINFGPWDRLDDNKPFINSKPKPDGANFYPEDMNKEEFQSFVAAHPDRKEDFQGYFTVIRRAEGGLIAVPYSQEYKDLLDKAAALLREAADILTAPENTSQFAKGVDYTTLATFLRSRADAFASNSYRQSDMDWMDVKDNLIDATIGPYEVYEDALFGYKAAFEAFIALRNPSESRKLEGIKKYLQTLENSLPMPDEHKNPQLGTDSPISVVDVVFTGGDNKAGVQTIAFNLPNDEVVQEQKGSKKVMLKNYSQAKFDKLLMPIAEQVMDSLQLKGVEFESYFNNTLMHEVSHGLGPGKIKLPDGTESTVNLALKELYSGIEEAKADILGLYCTRVLVKQGFLNNAAETGGYTCFVPGVFRAIRFGTAAAHGKANLMEFNFFLEQGAVEYDAQAQKFRVVLDKMPQAVEAMANKLLMIQALGDYEGAKAFIEKYSQSPPELDQMLAKLADIPTDFEPFFEAEDYLEVGRRRHLHGRPAAEGETHQH